MTTWETQLPRPITLPNGGVVKTLSDAREALLSLPLRQQTFPQWQALAGLLLSVVDTDDADIFAITVARLERELPRLR